MFPQASPEALDILKQMLQFNPNKRITAEKALAHPYVAQFHNPAAEPKCEKEIKIAIDDDHKFSIADYQTHLYNNIVAKSKESKKKTDKPRKKEKKTSSKDKKKKSKDGTSKKSESKHKNKEKSEKKKDN